MALSVDHLLAAGEPIDTATLTEALGGSLRGHRLAATVRAPGHAWAVGQVPSGPAYVGEYETAHGVVVEVRVAQGDVRLDMVRAGAVVLAISIVAVGGGGRPRRRPGPPDRPAAGRAGRQRPAPRGGGVADDPRRERGRGGGPGRRRAGAQRTADGGDAGGRARLHLGCLAPAADPVDRALDAAGGDRGRRDGPRRPGGGPDRARPGRAADPGRAGPAGPVPSGPSGLDPGDRRGRRRAPAATGVVGRVRVGRPNAARGRRGRAVGRGHRGGPGARCCRPCSTTAWCTARAPW